MLLVWDALERDAYHSTQNSREKFVVDSDLDESPCETFARVSVASRVRSSTYTQDFSLFDRSIRFEITQQSQYVV